MHIVYIFSNFLVDFCMKCIEFIYYCVRDLAQIQILSLTFSFVRVLSPSLSNLCTCISNSLQINTTRLMTFFSTNICQLSKSNFPASLISSFYDT